MTKYRIVQGAYLNGDPWFESQKKVWFFWHYIVEPKYGYFSFHTIEEAKKVIEIHKKYLTAKRDVVVWSSDDDN